MSVVPRRAFAFGMGVQTLGAAATLMTGIAIAWAVGPEAQGRYGLLRTTADLVLALTLFGFPQALVHAIHQQGASPAKLAHMSAVYGAGLFVVWIAVAPLLPTAFRPDWLDDSWALIALGLGVSGWLVQGLWRVLVLVVGDPLRFAWISVLPALTLFVAVLVTLVSDSQGFEWAICASGIASVLLAGAQLRTLRLLPMWDRGGPAQLARLVTSGAWAMAPSLAIALQPWLTLMLLQRAGAGDNEIGWFVFASLIPQAFAMPTFFVAPLLLERVSRAVGAGGNHSIRRWAPGLGVIFVGALAAAIAVALTVPWFVPAIFGLEYAAAVPACIWMAISGPFVVAGRLVVSVLFGRGAFRAAALHALARSLALPAAVLLALSAMPTDWPAATAIAWLVIELGGFALGAWLAHFHAKGTV